MSEFTGEKLFNLLPAIYRTRDAAQGWPLRALLGLIETQVMALEGDIARLYDNWFIETCDEWAVPYIGDLLDVRQLQPIQVDARATALFTQRGYVANTLGYRRAKGTRALLERIAHDVAGWPCVAVELFARLATTQHTNHVRPANRTASVRDPIALELVGGPFETSAHTLEVRHAAGERGRYNVPCVALYLWRLAALPLDEVAAVNDAGGGERFRLNPLGADLRLFNRGGTSAADAHGGEPSAPGPLRRLALHADLEAVRQQLADTGVAGASRYLGEDPPVVVRIASEAAPIPPAQIAICNLDDWKLPAPAKIYRRSDGTTVSLPIRVALDPTTGRIAFPAGTAPAAVRASLSYGTAGPIGGGAVRRTLSALGDRSLYIATGGGAALDAQLALWGSELPDEAVIEIADSLTYALPSALGVPADIKLEIRAAAGERPVIATASPATPWAISLAHGSVLRLDGIAIAAGLAVTGTGDATLAIADATLVPGRALTAAGDPQLPGAASVIGSETGGTLTVEIARSITGAIRLPTVDPASLIVSDSALAVADSIIDAAGGAALVAGSARIDRSTVIGATAVTQLVRASDALFTRPVIAQRTQDGCCRFSFLPEGSKVPRAYRCQPRLALKDALDLAAERAIIDRVQPAFTSLRYGDPGYAQLTRACAAEIRLGAGDESEMGAFQFLHQPQREANLRAAVDDHLRFGLEAGLFFVT